MGWGRRRNGEQHNVYLCVCLLPQKTVIDHCCALPVNPDTETHSLSIGGCSDMCYLWQCNRSDSV